MICFALICYKHAMTSHDLLTAPSVCLVPGYHSLPGIHRQGRSSHRQLAEQNVQDALRSVARIQVRRDSRSQIVPN